MSRIYPRPPEAKVFWFFSSEKNCFLEMLLIWERPFRMRRTWLAAGTAMLVLSGCTVGPDYKGPPRVIAEGSHSFVRGANVQAPDRRPDLRWWAALKDPELDRLELAALSANPDLDAARARLRESRAQLRAQQADLRPNTGTSALYLYTHGGTGALESGILGGALSPATAQGAAAAGSGSSLAGLSNDLSLTSIGFDATWEIDLFGAQRRAVESAGAAAQARQADMADVLVSLTADVAQAYISLRDVQNRATLAQASADLQARMLDLTRRRQEGGTASTLDVERLATQVEQTKADLVPLKGQIDAQLDRLAILTGRMPGELDADLAPAGKLPLPPETVAVGDPASLIRRRPDIRAAERRIAAQNALIGAHVAAYFPKVALLGNIGFVSTDVGQLLNDNSFVAVAAPALQWKPFDFGRTRAAVDQARAGRSEALATYRSTVLKALDDAETSLSRYATQREDVHALQRVMDSADHAARLQRQRYDGGTATLIDTLDTERQRVSAEQALAQAEAALTQDYVALQKSLGLGWE
jgi:NodT family efflux transporter outer membrane factor (OMF) lipoprotein